MGTRGYEYNQIRVRIHIITGSQIPVYYTRGYPFSYPLHACDGFYPWAWVFLPPLVGRNKCILYAGVGVRTPDTPLLHIKKVWVSAIRLPDQKQKIKYTLNCHLINHSHKEIRLAKRHLPLSKYLFGRAFVVNST